jgi:tRNA uridine 5-carboxymethylaminomethyl modification enzyme
VVRQGGEVDDYLLAVNSTPVTQALPLIQLVRRPEVHLAELSEALTELQQFSAAALERVETEIKYAGYIRKQQEMVDRFLRLEEKTIPNWIDYQQMPGISTEAREKLQQLRPGSVGQAGRISGVSPADIAVLLVYLETARREGKRDG